MLHISYRRYDKTCHSYILVFKQVRIWCMYYTVYTKGTNRKLVSLDVSSRNIYVLTNIHTPALDVGGVMVDPVYYIYCMYMVYD